MSIKNKLVCRSLSIHTTSACTLKCAKCGWSFPRYKKVIQADCNKTIAALDKVFQIYDEIREVRFGGAEAFLYPHIEELMEAVSAYKERFEYAIIVTNGTYVPRLSIIDTMRNLPYRMLVRVDNYGHLSKQYDKIVEMLRGNGIEIDERNYDGNDQAFGGWIDLGDYTDKFYTMEELNRVFYNCRVPDDCTILLDDKITICSYAFSGALMGKVSNEAREMIDLSGGQSIEELRNAVKAWRDTPLNACRYCNGCDPTNSPRIPAAEQLP